MNDVKDKTRLIVLINEKIAVISRQQQIIEDLASANRVLVQSNDFLRRSLDAQRDQYEQRASEYISVINVLRTQLSASSVAYQGSESLKAQFEQRLKKSRVNQSVMSDSERSLSSVAGICECAPNRALISKFGGLSAGALQKTLLSGPVSRELLVQIVRPLMHANSSLPEMRLTVNFALSSFQARSMLFSRADDCLCAHYSTVLQCIVQCDFIDNLLMEPELFDILDGLAGAVADAVSGALNAELLEQIRAVLQSSVDGSFSGLKAGYRLYFYAAFLPRSEAALGLSALALYVNAVVNSRDSYQNAFYNAFTQRMLQFFDKSDANAEFQAKPLVDATAAILTTEHDAKLQQTALETVGKLIDANLVVLDNQLFINALEQVLQRRGELRGKAANVLYTGLYLQNAQNLKCTPAIRSMLQYAADADSFETAQRGAQLVVQLDLRQLREHAVAVLLATAHPGCGHNLSIAFLLITFQANDGEPRDSSIYGNAKTNARLVSPNPERFQLCSELQFKQEFTTRVAQDTFAEVVNTSECNDEIIACQLALLLKAQPFKQETLDFFVKCFVHFASERGPVLDDCTDYLIDNYQHLQVVQLTDMIFAVIAAATSQFTYYETLFGRILELCRFVALKNEQLVRTVVRSRLIARKGCSQALRQKVLQHLVGQ